MLMFASRALKHAEEAQKISADTKARILRDFTTKAEEAVDKVAKAKGLTAETAEAIKANILGIKAKP